MAAAAAGAPVQRRDTATPELTGAVQQLVLKLHFTLLVLLLLSAPSIPTSSCPVYHPLRILSSSFFILDWIISEIRINFIDPKFSGIVVI